MEGLIMTAQLLLGLSILVGLHELGHLVAAKAFGMRVEKYSIGFPPKIFGIKVGETEYSLGALPLGGFVKISGMIDESLDTNHVTNEPRPWEFRSKPAWQRLIVMLGGIAVNVVTGIFIFIMLLYSLGQTYYATEDVNKFGVRVGALGEELGLQQGDKIVKINGQDFENFYDVLNPNYLLADAGYYTVIRDGERINIDIPADFIEKLSDDRSGEMFVDALMPFVVDSVLEGSNADKGGLKSGDKIIAVDGKPIEYFHEFTGSLPKMNIRPQKQGFWESIFAPRQSTPEDENSAGFEVDMKVERTVDGQVKTVHLTVPVNNYGKVGFIPKILLEPSRKTYSFWEAIPKGTEEAFSIITVQLKAFGKIFSGDVSASKSVSGPIGIAQFFGGTWNWVKFWRITGMLSMVLAFMNLLPIPALDGGHVVFLTYEMVSGRPPSDKFLEASQKVGMVLLLSLMVFAFGNDIFKFFGS